MLGFPGPDLFPESIRIEVLMICCRCMIDLGSLLCNFVKYIDGVAVVLVTLIKQSLANIPQNFSPNGQGYD